MLKGNRKNLVLGKKMQERSLHVLCIMCILIITFINLTNKNLIYVVQDEYGYWATAAHFAGFDWSDLLKHASYYSYGYSFLIAPLFWIFNNSEYMYKGAIVLNGVLLCGSYLLTYFSAKKIAAKMDKRLLAIFSLAVTLYSNNIWQLQLGWGECLLYFLFWCTVYLTIQIIEQPLISRIVVFGVILVYMFMVHQRTLGILISGAILMTILKLLKLINWKQYLAFLVTIIIAYVIHLLIKNNLQNTLWSKSLYLTGNDFGGQRTRLMSIVTDFSQFKLFVKGVLGRIHYLVVSSFFLLVWGVYYCCINISKAIINKVKLQEKNVQDTMKALLSVFLLLSLVSTMLIASISLVNGSRVDHLFYGRYNEMLIGPFILLGFIALNQLKHLVKIQLFFTVLSILLGVYLAYVVKDPRYYSFNEVCATGIYWAFEKFGKTKEFIYATMALAIALVSMYIFLIKRKKNRMVLQVIAVIVVIGVWYTTSLSASKVLLKSYGNWQRIVGATKALNLEEESDIYFVSLTGDRNNVVEWIDFRIQFVFPKESIIHLNYDRLGEIELEKTTYFIVATTLEALVETELYQNFELIGEQSGIFCLRYQK
jgi:hypothetical protein